MSGEDTAPGRRRRSERPSSFVSYVAWLMFAGWVLGLLLSVLYYRIHGGAPAAWKERRSGRNSWWGVERSGAAKSIKVGKRLLMTRRSTTTGTCLSTVVVLKNPQGERSDF